MSLPRSIPRTPETVARCLLQLPLLRSAFRQWDNFRDWIDAFAFGCRFIVARRPRPRLLLYFGFSLGDNLLVSAVFRELRQRAVDRVILLCNNPELFVGGGDGADVLPFWRRYIFAPSYHTSAFAICRKFVRLWGGEFIQLGYTTPVGDDDRERPPPRHIIAELCARVGISGPVAIRPYLNLADSEKMAAAWAAGSIVIQSSGMGARDPTRNKEWYPERFQAVVDALRGEIDFVQLGGRGDPQLRHAKDLRGRTGLRETAAVLHNARLYVGAEGFLMHLARAVECPSVIVFGGRIAPWQIGYTCNLNLYSATPCAPCWRRNTCDYDRQCMQQIAVSDVVAAIRQMLQRPRNPLAVDTADIEAGEKLKVNLA